MIFDTRFFGQHRVRIHVVDQREGVATFCVSEVKINAFMLHQAHHEIKIGLLVLDAVVPLARSFSELLHQRKTVRCQHLFNDLRHSLELKYFAITATASDPQPRPQFGGVDVVFAFARTAGETGANAVEMTHPFGTGFNL